MERSTTIKEINHRYGGSVCGTIDIVYLETIEWPNGEFEVSISVEPLDGGIFPPCVTIYKKSFNEEKDCVDNFYELKEQIENRLNVKFSEHHYEEV